MAIMNTQLNSWLLLDHAPRHFPEVEVVTQLAPGQIHRYNYRQMVNRTYQLMNALENMGLANGDRVATLAWNGYYHLECYFGIPSVGLVIHTLNARLSPADLTFIINDAEDKVIFVAPDLIGQLEAIADEIPTVTQFIVLSDHVPSSTLPNLISYESLIAGYPDTHEPIFIDEHTPSSLCYTSGTTGRPKGALYTHRSTYLHAMGCALPSAMGISPSDCVLPIVPMFHASAWGSAHAAVAMGAKLVFAATPLDAPSLLDLIADEKVTVTAGVPTVWIQLAEELSRTKVQLPHLRDIIVGGSQPPRPLIERYRDEFGLRISQAWGMTETSPLASLARPKFSMADLGTTHASGRSCHFGSGIATTQASTTPGMPMIAPAPSLLDLIADEKVTVTAGVPTVWIQLAEELSRTKVQLPHLRDIIVGGSQPPRPLIERYRDEFGLRISQAWGMTETSPLASLARPKFSMADLGADEYQDRVGGMAGLPVPGISVSIRDENGNEVLWDGKSMGQLHVKGAWVIDSYLHNRGSESFTADGWFATGDVAIGTPDGYFVIADRTKDLIKSGGEWISSVEMEGAIMGIPGVVEACVVAIPDPKWQERPLACVVPREGVEITLEVVREHLLKSGFAKWQLPERLEIIDAVPRTSVGKFDKKVLRTKFGE